MWPNPQKTDIMNLMNEYFWYNEFTEVRQLSVHFYSIMNPTNYESISVTWAIFCAMIYLNSLVVECKPKYCGHEFYVPLDLFTEVWKNQKKPKKYILRFGTIILMSGNLKNEFSH